MPRSCQRNRAISDRYSDSRNQHQHGVGPLPSKAATSDGGWKTHKSAGGFSALSLSFAWALYQELDIPIGILLSAHSNTRIEAFTQRKAIEGHPRLIGDRTLIHDADPATEQGRKAFDTYYKDLRAWQAVAGKAADLGGRVPTRPKLPGISGMWRGPSQFFNGKINPIIPFAIRGAIWCQGTSNSGDGRIYAARMEALVNGWRDAWDMPEMPFYFTQMQCYGSPDPNSVGFADGSSQNLCFIILIISTAPTNSVRSGRARACPPVGGNRSARVAALPPSACTAVRAARAARVTTTCCKP